MKIEAIIVADSISPQGNRIVTFELIYPRIIHSELMTHRLFSKNSASSRAIPFSKMVKAVQENTFIPIAWQKQHSGMQGSEYLYGIEAEVAERNWEVAKDNALRMATHLYESGVTKQLCNRLLEPFMYHKVLLTATEFDNFFELRCPKYILNEQNPEAYKSKIDFQDVFGNKDYDNIQWLLINKGQSEIHMMQLAECMYDAMNESIPKQLKAGEYHIPYGDTINVLGDTDFKEDVLTKIKISTAKCARTSYTTVGEDGKEIPYEKDIALHDSLIASGHMSPTEHIARAMSDDEYYADFIRFENGEKKVGWCLNYRGFIQYRYLLQNQ